METLLAKPIDISIAKIILDVVGYNNVHTVISKDFIDKLLETVDIVDVIGQRINIQRSGSSLQVYAHFIQIKNHHFLSINKTVLPLLILQASGNAIKFIRR